VSVPDGRDLLTEEHGRLMREVEEAKADPNTPLERIDGLKDRLREMTRRLDEATAALRLVRGNRPQA